MLANVFRNALLVILVHSAVFAECTKYPKVQSSLSGVSLKGRFQLQKNYAAFEVEIRENYEVSFTLKPQKISSGWSNVLRITNNVGNGDLGMGNRIPGVWFHSMTTRLHICTGCDGISNLCLNPTQSLPIGRSTRITIRVNGGYFTAQYDGKEVGRYKCSLPYEPRKGQLATVYTSDKWYASAHAVIEDLVYSADLNGCSVQSTPDGAYLSRRVQLQRNYKALDVALRRNYQVSFSVNPQSVSSGWRNILHITNNLGEGNHGQMGNRIPGVWFHSMTTKLHICIGCDGNFNLCMNPEKSLPIGKNTQVTIRVDGGFFTAYYDSQEVGRVKCFSPYEPWQGQLGSIYTSDKWSSAHAVIENLVYSASSPACPIVQSTFNGAYLRRSIQLKWNQKVFDVEVRGNYEVSFTLNPISVSPGWRNILHITNNVGGGNYGYMGNRIPGVWFHSMTTKLHICTGCDRNHNLCLNPGKSLPIGRKTRVSIRVNGGYFAAQYDSQEVGRAKCFSPYKSVHHLLASVYTSDRWSGPAHAVIEDLQYSLL